MIPQETLTELVKLRERVEELEAELEQFKHHDITALKRLRSAFRTTIGECRTLLVLARGGIISSDQIVDAYCDGLESKSVLARDAMKRIRKRLPDLKITTHYGFGYELEGEHLQRVRAVIKNTENHHNDQ